MNKLKTNHQHQWLRLMNNFEIAKKAFKPDGKCSLNIPLPYSFGADLERSITDYINDLGD